MAIINAADYDHIDVVNGADTNRHMLKDAQARQDVADLKSAFDALPAELGYELEDTSKSPTVANYNAAGSGTLVDDSTLSFASGASVLNARIGRTFLFNNSYFIGKTILIKPHYTYTGDKSRFVLDVTKQSGNDAELTVLDDSIDDPVILVDMTNATLSGVSYKYIYVLLRGTGNYTVSEATTVTLTGIDVKIYNNTAIENIEADMAELQADMAELQADMAEVDQIRNSETVSINTLLEGTNATQNGATYSSPTLTIPSGSTGNNSYVGCRVIGTNFNEIKGKTIEVVCNFTISENLSGKVAAYVALYGTGYTINSAVWDGTKVTANVTIDSDTTSTYVVVGLKVVNSTDLSANATITRGTYSGSYTISETYRDAVERVASQAAESITDENFLTDITTLNLFDKTKAVTTGMWGNTGSFITTSYQNSTGLIPIGDYTTFRMNRDESTVPTWTLWKSDGTTFVRGVEARSITIDPTTDSEAAYLRCSFLATEIDTVMIIPNAHPCMSEYFPYNSPRKSMKGEWVGKHLVTIGDSLTQMGYWQEMVTQMLGMSYTVAAQSGGNMTAIAGFVDSVTDADAMTVWAGTNDWYGGISLGTLLGTDRNTYYGALRHVCEEVSTNLPGCKLLFITPLQRNTTNTDSWEEDSRGFKKNPTTGHTLEEFANAMIATAEIYGFPVLDMFHHGGVNKINIDAWTSDKLHPSKAQFERLAWKIISKINSI